MPNELVKLTQMDKALQEVETIEDASRLIAISNGILATAKKLYKGGKDINCVKEDKDRAGQIAVKAGEIVLKAEAKLGELLSKSSTKGTFKKGGEKSLPLGITKKESHIAQEIYRHKNLIPEIVKEAKEIDDIPTKAALFRKIKEEKREEESTEKFKKKEFPKDIFNVIYADPPWQYNNSGFNSSAESKYPTMSIFELSKIQIKTPKNSILFLWATNPLLQDAFTLLKNWGFEYKTNFVWEKTKSTYGKLGFYVFGQHELLLIATKGSMLPKEKYKSIIHGENKIHSKKPHIVYEMIEKMYPNQKYLEMFARNERSGWTSWGNQI